jgi:hypothetical protein
MIAVKKKIGNANQAFRLTFVGALYLSAIAICLLSFCANELLPLENAGGGIESIHHFFYIDFEANLPSWFSSMQLFVLGVLLGLVAWRNLKGKKSIESFTLVFLASFFVVLSLDEAAEMHERVGMLTDLLLPGQDRSNSMFHDTGIWAIVLGLPVASFVFFVLFKLKTFFAWESQIIIKYVVGLSLFFGGSIGLELIINFFDAPMLRSSIKHFEELFEMTGVATMIWATLDLLSTYNFRIMLDPANLSSSKK